GHATCGEQWRVGAELEFLDRLVVLCETLDRQVAPGGGAGDPATLGFGDRREDRHLPVVVVINPNPELDFIGSLVGNKRLGQTENGVATRKWHRGNVRRRHEGLASP